MSIPVYKHRETGDVVQLLIDDKANRAVQIQHPGSRKIERMGSLEFFQQFERVPDECGSYTIAKAIIEHAEQTQIAEAHDSSAPDPKQLERIEANQAAILAGLNRLGRFLKLDWQEIEAAQ